MGYYEIIVKSHIDAKRRKDFNVLDFKLLPEGKTLLYGNLQDQAELFSVLNKIRDMNIALLSMYKDQKEEVEQ